MQTATVTLSRANRPQTSARPRPTTSALILHTSGSTGRPKRVPLSHANLSISAGNVARSYALSQRRRVAVRDAAVPRARPRGVDAGHAVHRRHRGRAREVQPALVLAHRARTRRHVVFGGADDPSVAARACREGRRPTGWRREAALHSIVQRVAPAAGHARPRGRIRCAGARSVRHDRSGAPDGVESAAAGRSASRGRSAAARTCRSASWTPSGKHLPPASAARSSSRDRTS